MRTRLLLIAFLLLSLYPSTSFAQLGVADPAHTAISTNGWIFQFKNMLQTFNHWTTQYRQMKEKLEIEKKIQNIQNIKELKSLREIAEMIDQVQCISQEYQFHMSLGKTYQCAKFLNVQHVTVNMRMTTDLLFKVTTVADFFSMSSGERISMVKTIQESLSTATQAMEEFSVLSRNSIKADAVKSYYRDRYYGRMLNHRNTNRS